MSRFTFLCAFIFAVAFMVFAAPRASATEKPDYTVLVDDGKIEIREYPPMILAEVTVTGDRKEAGNKAFKKLAGFIFGDNEARVKLDATSPVVQTRQEAEKIKMTAPVVQTQTQDNLWVVNFMMPSKYTLETLPIPDNKDIRIRATEPYKAITIEFSGNWKKSKWIRKTEELKAYAKSNNLKISGLPDYAFYDAPFVPGFARRNEVQFRLID